ncbi:polyketide synthase [Aureobasidium pullulans]|uniref:Polyketide synthase n=1 Tax=Aureobasidium pullulans TaxID=5580 RepID=A0A4S8WY69_AURPU|nr:polyketide synthase [Aureobasidium pullulans]
MNKDVMPIAIVGMAFRGPGDASNVQKLYELVAEARESWSPIPVSRWAADAFYHPSSRRNGSSHVKGGHFFKQDLSLFDAPFFGMREDEAACLDPQQRMLLECCYEALENSESERQPNDASTGGTPMKKAVGSNTSVFVGTFGADFPELLYRDAETMPMYQVTNAGNSRAILSNRLSYFFDFKGPSVTIDTACSASLVAFHLACQSLRTGDAEQAIVGGSSVILNNDLFVSMSAMGFLSPEGRCYSFDERAEGYGRGEGVGCIMLKPLEHALRDGDTIRAVVRNTGSNQDGKTPGITFPSGDAQTTLIRNVYAKVGLDPSETDYVEAHGTGTQAGDPIEAAALSAVFGKLRPEGDRLRIGSVKSNLGHLEGASGIAGLIKSVLMLENRVILPSRNFERPNKRIPLDEWGLEVPTRLEPWTADGPRRISVNGFGYGGTNAHAILEALDTFIQQEDRLLIERRIPALAGVTCSKTAEGRKRLFVLASHDQEAGRKQARQLLEYLENRTIDEKRLQSLAYTLSERRSQFKFRLGITACSSTELIASLQAEDLKPIKALVDPTIGFVFTGQGAQWATMGCELIDDVFPVYRNSLIRSGEQLQRLGASWDLIDELYKNAENTRVNLAEFSQPLCTALQCALVDLLRHWGIVPHAVIGHSSGELAAAYCIGAMSLDTTMTSAYYRGVVAASLSKPGKLRNKGAMMAVALGKKDIEPILSGLTRGVVRVACENSPLNVTVSGDADGIDELYDLLHNTSSVFKRKLKVDVAYHSHHMQVIGDEYLACIPKIEMTENNSIKYFSSVTAELAEARELDELYWVTNLLNEVKFSPALSKLCYGTVPSAEETVNMLVEIGPHSALAGPIKQILSADKTLKNSRIAYASALVRNQDAVTTVLDLASKLFTRGFPVSIDNINNPGQDQSAEVLVDLPPYAWNHTRSFWAEGRISKAYGNRKQPRSDVLGVLNGTCHPSEAQWRNVVRLSEVPWLREHKVQGNVVYPAGGFMAMAVEAAGRHASEMGVEVDEYIIREVTISRALIIPEQTEEVETLLTLRPHHDATRAEGEIWKEFNIYSVDINNTWTQHCRGMISSRNLASANGVSLVQGQSFAREITLAEQACSSDIEIRRFYDDVRQSGLDYGPSFARITAARASKDMCVARLSIADTAQVMPEAFEYPMTVHPTTFDSFLHTIFMAITSSGEGFQDPMVPVAIKQIRISSKLPTKSGSSLDVFTFNQRPGPDDVLLHIDTIRLTTLASDTLTETVPDLKHLAWMVEWCKDPEFHHASQNYDRYLENESTSSSQSRLICNDSSPANFPQIKEEVLDRIDLLVSKNSQMCFIRVGESSVVSDAEVLGVLGGTDAHLRCASYDITNQSATKLEHVQKELRLESTQIRFLTFDADTDPEQQGFRPSSYDVLLASESETKEKTLCRLPSYRQLIKPGGTLVLSHSFEHGSDWCQLVLDAGFCDIKTTSSSSHRQSLIFASVGYPERKHQEVVLITQNQDTCLVGLSHLVDLLSEAGISVTVSRFNQTDLHNKICIVLSEITEPFLDSPTEAQFSFTKAAMLHSAGVLWVTRGAHSTHPRVNTITGLARTARSENNENTIVTLDLDGQTPIDGDRIAKIVFDLFCKKFLLRYHDLDTVDLEFRELGGELYIPRLVPDESINNSMTGPSVIPQKLVQPERPLHIQVGAPGLLDSLHWTDNHDISPTIPDGHVEVEVRAAGVNFRDVMIALDQIGQGELGGECSGVVKAVGKGVTGFETGDRVAFLHLGAFTTRAQPKASLVRHIPMEMSFETAAALPVVYVTAYHSLFELAKLRKSEKVLIHAAAGGVGQAAIELCQLAGADIYVTVGSAAKKQMIVDRYNVPEDQIFYSRDGSFYDGIMNKTDGRGVDVILNSVAGEAHRLTWKCIGAFGRFIELGKRDIFVNTRLEMEMFAKNVSFFAFDLVDMIAQRPEACGRSWQTVLTLLETHLVKPPAPISCYPMSQATKVLQMMQAGKHMGKLILTIDAEDTVEATKPEMTKALFSKEASYLLIGGLGGVGRAIASWMLNNGARHLIIANRSGIRSPGSQAAVAELERQGGQIQVVACDVGSRSDVKALIQESSRTMPPIRGVFQSAMLLRDTMLETMTLNGYTQGLHAKVQGTWNLHELLPQDLDFFVMLSSISGVIGNISQANYAAANTFLDAMAEYRNLRGMAATTLDLGVITGVGHLAENRDLAESMARQGFHATNKAQLLSLMRQAVLHPRRQRGQNQIVSGLGAWSNDSIPAFSRQMFSHFRRITKSESERQQEPEDDGLPNLKTLGLKEATERICNAVQSRLSDLCMIPVEDIHAYKGLTDYGIDSLVAIELRNWIFRRFNCTLPILELMSTKPIDKLSASIAERVLS